MPGCRCPLGDPQRDIQKHGHQDRRPAAASSRIGSPQDCPVRGGLTGTLPWRKNSSAMPGAPPSCSRRQGAHATARVKADATARIKATADRIKHAAATWDAAIAAAREKEARVRAEAEEEIRRAHAEPKQNPAGAQKVRRWEAAAHFTRGEAVAERASWLRIWTRRRPVPAKLTVSLTEPPADRAAEPERVSVKADATARIKDAADRIKVAAATRDAAIAAARAEEARVRARAQEEIKQARDAAEPLGARGKPAGRAKQRATSIAGGHDAAIAAKARAASAKKALRRVSAKAERRINAATQARDEAASVVADLKQERARARARGKASAKKALRRAKARRRKANKALRRVRVEGQDLIYDARRRARVEAQDLIYAAARARDNAEDLVPRSRGRAHPSDRRRRAEASGRPGSRAASHGRRGYAGPDSRRARTGATPRRAASRDRRGQGWRSQRWEAAQASPRRRRSGAGSWVGGASRSGRSNCAHLTAVHGGTSGDRGGSGARLWDTTSVYGRPRSASMTWPGCRWAARKNEVDQFLLEVMYCAHDLNNGTLSRRADLLRFAPLFVLAFVITLGVWLPSHV